MAMTERMRLFRFRKDYNVNGIHIQEGSYIEYFRGLVSMNGGILEEQYQPEFRMLIESELKTPNYLTEEEPWF